MVVASHKTRSNRGTARVTTIKAGQERSWAGRGRGYALSNRQRSTAYDVKSVAQRDKDTPPEARIYPWICRRQRGSHRPVPLTSRPTAYCLYISLSIRVTPLTPFHKHPLPAGQRSQQFNRPLCPPTLAMAAYQFPVQDPPRTPTTSDDEMDPQLAESGLRIKHAYNQSPVRSRLSGSFDRLSASPPDTASTSMNTGRTDLISPTFSLSTPADASFTPHTVVSEVDDSSEKEDEPTITAPSPFNFTTQQYSATLSPAKPVSMFSNRSWYTLLTILRKSTLESVAVTSTSTPVSHTRSLSNQPLALLFNYPLLSPSLLAMKSNTA